MSEQFDPKRAVKNIGGKREQLYLQVKDRKRWFREENPTGSIKADVLVLDIERGYASVKATVTNEAGGVAEDYGSAWRELLFDRAQAQNRPDAAMIAGDFLEWATTSAIGRALAGLGYGTEEALDADLGAPADAPTDTRRAQPPQEPRHGAQAIPNPNRPANGPSVPAGAVLTPDQQATIRNAVAALGWGAPDCTAYLRQFGVTRFGELSQEQATEVIPDLLSKAAEIEAA